MKPFLTRIIILFFLLIFITINPLQAATEQRIALVIGNSAYNSGPLKNPVNDATDMAAVLKKLGFTVTLKKNAKLQEMDESVREFGRQLKRTRGVGLFYYAGHSMQISGVNYLLPVNARIEKESDVRFQSINADMVLAEMENAENAINIVILDACRDNPFSRSFRNAVRGLAIISNAPSGTFISYSTGANQVARDGQGKNSPYTRALLQNIDTPGLSINNVFMKVRSKLKKETGQIPWELSSLEGDFYFVPGSARKTAVTVPSEKATVEREESSMTGPDRKDKALLVNKQSPYFQIVTLAGGARYEGDIINNQPNGKGTWTLPSGERYEGEFRDSKRSGQGIFTFADGQRYEGEFRDDKYNGQGTLTFPNGQRYEGEFRDGKRSGQGTYYFPNGENYIGAWENDKRNGQGINIYANGGRYEGEFRDDKRNGQGIFTFPDGRVLNGRWENDVFKP